MCFTPPLSPCCVVLRKEVQQLRSVRCIYRSGRGAIINLISTKTRIELNSEVPCRQACSLPCALPPQVDHVKKPDNWALLEAARVVYSAGFFITVSPESILLAAKHCADNDKIYCMNLSALFIMQVKV